MTIADYLTLTVALLAAVATIVVNWSVLRGDHAGLKRILLIGEALDKLPAGSAAYIGLEVARDRLAERTVTRIYPDDGHGPASGVMVFVRVLAWLSVVFVAAIPLRLWVASPDNDLMIPLALVLAIVFGLSAYLVLRWRARVVIGYLQKEATEQSKAGTSK